MQGLETIRRTLAFTFRAWEAVGEVWTQEWHSLIHRFFFLSGSVGFCVKSSLQGGRGGSRRLGGDDHVIQGELVLAWIRKLPPQLELKGNVKWDVKSKNSLSILKEAWQARHFCSSKVKAFSATKYYSSGTKSSTRESISPFYIDPYP